MFIKYTIKQIIISQGPIGLIGNKGNDGPVGVPGVEGLPGPKGIEGVAGNKVCWNKMFIHFLRTRKKDIFYYVE